MPYEYLHPDDVPVAKRAVEALQQNRVPSTKIEYRIRKRGGEYAWVETNFVRVVKSDQTLSHFQAVTRDISDRKNAEQALAKRTEELSVTNKLLVDEAARRQALERRVLLSIESALGQVGLELHDDLGQQLTGISLLVKTLEHKLTSYPPHAERSTAREAARISELVNRAINHTRMISHGLSPYIGGESGLAAALLQLANDIDSLGVVSCVAEVDASVEVNDEVAARSLYRIAQEATNNALKHSGASLVRISLKMAGPDLQLTIGDDGLSDISALEHGPHTGQIMPSLYSIRHRAQAIGARVAFRHFAGKGTFVCIRWQVAERPPRAAPARLTSVSRAA
jgi:signal transduction histidine kinase